MYEQFFNLTKKPFELVPDPCFIYLSRAHKKALTYLDYGIRERAGFILLTGEVGSGKTTLIRDLLSKKYERVVVAKVFNTRVRSEQLLAMINEDFGLPVAGLDKISLLRQLNDFLLEQYARGKQPMLIIDEAQNLAADLLEEIRMLSNLESSHGKLLQIMLVGQPELRETLAAPELLQLRQRISINCHLRSLSREETAEYITHRMEVAGNAGALEIPAGSLELVHHCSRGIPRLINIICDFLLLSAFADGARSASVQMVRDIMRDLDFENNYWGPEVMPAEGSAVQADLHPARSGLQVDELSRRLEAVEQDFIQRVPAALKEISDSLSALRQEFSARLARSEQQVAELSRKVASPALRPECKPVPKAAAGVGFMRRLFGATYHQS